MKLICFFTFIFFLNLPGSHCGFPPGFRPASAIPDEFFTCFERSPGLYADDKRSCSLYWKCSSNGTLDHLPCPRSAPVFDDRVRSCVRGDRGKCPLDYGNFQSASSFCRGRPYMDSNFKGRDDDMDLKMAQAYYANRLNNCDSYFVCTIIDGHSKGMEFKCAEGKKFKDEKRACVKAELVDCPVSHGADLG